MPRKFSRARLRPRTRRGVRGTLVATAATLVTALLTAGSSGPGPLAATGSPDGDGTRVPGGFVPPGAPLADVPSQGDGSYHVELPPLDGVKGAAKAFGRQADGASPRRIAAESGLPATVFAAYRKAAGSLGRTDPGCGLRWELLAAIGKVESGHAGGGAVAADGDTLRRITGPALDGNGFALILDTEGGAWDGDPVYDRAVGPMQFLPSTWKRWGADGNGDGVANPNNIYDAALAAGRYLCAGDRDLRTAAGLERAILSYNYSRDYLNLVLGWMEFYLRGVHSVPDGAGVVPESPGAGGQTPATRPVPERGDEGAEEGDDEENGGNGATPSPSASAPAGPKPPTVSPTPSVPPRPSTPPQPSPEPTPTTLAPGGGSEPEPLPSATEPLPSASEPGPDPSASPTESPEATPSDSTTPSPGESATPTAAVTA